MLEGRSSGEGRGREVAGSALASVPHHPASCQQPWGPVRHPEEQLCEPKSSWSDTPLTWGPEEEPWSCSLLPPQPLLQLACRGVQGWALSSSCLAVRAQTPVYRCGSSCLAQGCLTLLWAPCPAQPTATDKARAEGS